ncbi:survival protein sure-like phosphatase/nucleotidase [Daedalea quercina L-15889]|uniref:Survival protein sure-like phosphatase/nucleotidase n=1 Tax=Daedalea quercina L-15889 TaxID=1314783 RepID=A0A165QH37_9APHY|nr:survival protein sure-like phosphatase/nucleotidase [Daedalea quercina L-15889]
MHRLTAIRIVTALSCISAAWCTGNIVSTNDDGWAVAQIRALYTDLTAAGFDVVISAPADNESGTGSSTETPQPLTEPCEYDSCPAGSPAEGYNASDPHLNYVNAYPVDAVEYGIQTLAPEFFSGAGPDFVTSGPNIGNNLGLAVLFSGTVGAACEAAKEGVPATAFSGDSGSEVSYTTLYSDPTASSTEAAWIYSALTVLYTQALFATDNDPLLPAGIIVSVNYPSIDNCSDASDYKWVLSRNLWDPFASDFAACSEDGSVLPTESDVVGTTGCYNSVTVLNATTKADVDSTLQGEVYSRLRELPFSCLPSS